MTTHSSKQTASGPWRPKFVLIVLIATGIVGHPLAAFCGSDGADAWQSFYRGEGGVSYAFSPKEMVRDGEEVVVPVRSVEAMTSGKDMVTTVH
jgi:hypothetical protein